MRPIECCFGSAKSEAHRCDCATGFTQVSRKCVGVQSVSPNQAVMRALLVQHPFERCESAECKMQCMLRVCRSKLHADLETISFKSKCRLGRR